MPDRSRDETTDKRKLILDAARSLFARHGYDETTIAEIARQAGVAVGTVYLYFENKHDVLMDVCLELNTEIAQVIQSPEILGLPLRQMPRAIIETTFRHSREHLAIMTFFQVEAQTPREMQRIRDAKQEIAQSLDGLFQTVIAIGQLEPFDTAAYAVLINGLVENTLTQCFGIERGEREAFYREGVIELIERLFFGPPLVTGGAATGA